jgi:hypothetical protein
MPAGPRPAASDATERPRAPLARRGRDHAARGAGARTRGRRRAARPRRSPAAAKAASTAAAASALAAATRRAGHGIDASAASIAACLGVAAGRHDDRRRRMRLARDSDASASRHRVVFGPTTIATVIGVARVDGAVGDATAHDGRRVSIARGGLAEDERVLLPEAPRERSAYGGWRRTRDSDGLEAIAPPRSADRGRTQPGSARAACLGSTSGTVGGLPTRRGRPCSAGPLPQGHSALRANVAAIRSCQRDRGGQRAIA